jgi:hypothetical protein
MLVFLRVHTLADFTSLSVTPSSAGLMFWTSTVCQTEIGYRMKAYTIFWRFARVLFTNLLICKLFYTFFMCIFHTK